jgi:hypothetical protein
MRKFIGILDNNTRQIPVEASRIDYATRKLARRLFRDPIIRGYVEYSPTSAEFFVMPSDMVKPGHQVRITEHPASDNAL